MWITFLNFLRGMETLNPNIPCSYSPAFLNFLRGMETPNNMERATQRADLPKLP